MLASAVALASGVPGPMAGPAQASDRPAPASIGVRLEPVPGSQPANPQDRSYIVQYMKIGTRIRRVITVSNTSSSTRRISVYAGAASVMHGRFAFGPSAAPNELTTWTRLSKHFLVLKPNTADSVTVTVTVPRDASPGQRFGVIWAQITAASKGITLVNRVGIRMYIAVGKGGPPPPAFAITSMTAIRDRSGTPTVVAQVRNIGIVALDLTGTLRLFRGPGGTSAGPMPVSSNVTLPAGKAILLDAIVSRKLPLGPWHAVMTLAAGQLRRTARATLTFPARRSASAGLAGWLPSAGIALTTVLLGIAAYVVLGSRRRVRAAQPPRHSSPPTARSLASPRRR
jgi:hypothetical protein